MLQLIEPIEAIKLIDASPFAILRISGFARIAQGLRLTRRKARDSGVNFERSEFQFPSRRAKWKITFRK
jgi:hypothetical protein